LCNGDFLRTLRVWRAINDNQIKNVGNHDKEVVNLKAKLIGK
jgi:hypothetical protein